MRATDRTAHPPALALVLAVAVVTGCASNQTADPAPVMASQADLARIRQAVAPCLRKAWAPPSRHRTARVTLKWRLDEDGRIVGTPEVIEQPGSGNWQGSPVADAAIRAVRACEPFKLPLGEYHLWKEIVFSFDAIAK